MVEISEPGTEDAAPPRKRGGLMIALLGALVSGGLGYVVASLGYLDPVVAPDDTAPAEAGFAFVPLDTLSISLGPEANARTLRFAAELEVEPHAAAAVAAQRPRIVDVLNGFLRAVDEAELADPAALAILRAQMLRRIQTVVGDGQVRDLLILEFILT